MLKRTGFSQERTASQRRCAHCNGPFWPSRPLQSVCGRVCAGKKAKADRVAKLESRKEAIQTIPELIKLAQKDFNAFIRERDRIAGHQCISSGKPLDWSGNGVDAGHYRSVGAASHLRFDERNCHAQSRRDNQYRAGNAVDYRIGLIERIGLAAVEALEADNTVKKWDRDELRAIRADYKSKLKALKERTA